MNIKVKPVIHTDIRKLKLYHCLAFNGSMIKKKHSSQIVCLKNPCGNSVNFCVKQSSIFNCLVISTFFQMKLAVKASLLANEDMHFNKFVEERLHFLWQCFVPFVVVLFFCINPSSHVTTCRFRGQWTTALHPFHIRETYMVREFIKLIKIVLHSSIKMLTEIIASSRAGALTNKLTL